MAAAPAAVAAAAAAPAGPPLLPRGASLVEVTQEEQLLPAKLFAALELLDCHLADIKGRLLQTMSRLMGNPNAGGRSR